MKGKPIEPGCLAMVVGMRFSPENNGRTVQVVRRAEAGYVTPGQAPKHYTRVTSEVGWVCMVPSDALPMVVAVMRSAQVLGKRSTWERAFSQKNLIRIDGDPADVLWEKKEKEAPKPREDVY